MLPEKTLIVLREYFKEYRPKGEWLFVTAKGMHITGRAVQDAFKLVVKKSGFKKHITIHTIQNCRTSILGGHIDICNDCGYSKISYNSCRNRHCPTCQTLSKERWILAREEELLPVDCQP